MRRGVRRWGPLVAAVVSGVLASGVVPASGADSSPGNRPQAELLHARRATIAGRTQAALLDLYAAQARLEGARRELEAIRSRATELEAEIASVRHKTAITRRSLAVSRQRLAQLVRSLYIEGAVDPLAVVLGAESLDAALAGIDSLQRAAELDRELAAQALSSERRLDQLRVRLESSARNLRRADAAAGGALAELQTAVDERAATLASLRRQDQLTRRQIDALEHRARAATTRSAKLVRSITPAYTATVATSAPAVQATAPSRPSGTFRLTVDAVAYHLPGRTATGLAVGVGVVAVDPSVIPLGTRMYIPGYGSGVAADVGSAIKGRIIDLWMPTSAAARQWGRQTVTIVVYR